jgi:hypothetical protein
MARTLYDTAQNASTPAAGHYADIETKVEQLGGLVNEHATALDKVITPAGVGAFKGTAVAPIVDGDTAGGIPVRYTYQIADAASADYDIIVDSQIEVVDVEVIKTGGAGGAANTVQVKQVTVPGGVVTTISDAISININQDAIARSAVRTQANATIPAGGKLRASTVKAGGNAACEVIVHAIKR